METYQKEKLNLTFYKGVKMETNKSPVNFSHYFKGETTRVKPDSQNCREKFNKNISMTT